MQHLNRYLLISLVLGLTALAAHSLSASLTHILMSFIALSILGLAAVQSMVITLQNYLLKRHPLQTYPMLQFLPPVQTMQKLLFQVIWAGFIFLSLSFLGAFIFLPNVLQNIQLSKLVLSTLAWGLFATLLYGYHRSGWRNDVVTSRTLIGVLLLTIAYFGSKWIEQH
jgi:ABC-type uncharacterized transport system permease subunit